MISVADLALITLAMSFGLYGLFCGALCGISLARLWPKLLGRRKHVKMENPAWEGGNLFLLLGLGGFALVFNKALVPLGQVTDYWLILGLVALLVRISMVFWIARQRDSRQITAPVKVLFTAVCFTVPLSLAAIGTFMLFGEQFWHSVSAGLLMLSCLLGLCAVGLAVVNAKKSYLQMTSAAWLMVLGVLWPLSLEMNGSQLLGYWLGLLLSFGIVIISVVVITDGLSNRHYLRLAVPVLAFMAFPLLASAANPHLVSGQITTTAAFTSGSDTAIIFLSVGVLASVAAGLKAFAKLSEPKLNWKSKP